MTGKTLQADERTQVVEDLANGVLAARDLVGLRTRDIVALQDLAAQQMQAARHEAAAKIYRLLQDIEPDVPEHTLRLADAQGKAGAIAEAVASCTKYLVIDEERSAEGVALAYMMRSQLVAQSDPYRAQADLAAAKRLGEDDPQAAHVVLGAQR